jgi:lysophospholipase L1-like esterase
MLKLLRVLPSVALCAMLIAVTAPPAAASDPEPDPLYLALGDSVAFGFNPLLDFRNIANFVGYPEVLASRLDLDLTNASCPGETSAGFISLTGIDNGCRPYRALFPLHVSYTTSQLDFAVAFLLAHPNTSLVTIDIGANDLFVLERQCGQVTTCVANGLPALLQHLAADLATIYGRIRGQAHYHGQIIALTYYAMDYNNPLGVAITHAINEVITHATRAADGQVANGFNAFRAIAEDRAGGSSCAAGLLIVTGTNPLTCDVHPSPFGRDVLAATVAALVHPRRT